MGIASTAAAWLIVAAAVGIPHVTMAADAGPGKEVRAIRHDLPILLRGELWQHGSDPHVDGVIVDGPTAIAQTHGPDGTSFERLDFRFGRWWLDREILVDSCPYPLGPTTAFLTSRLHAPAALAQRAATLLPAVIAANARPTPTPPATGQLMKVGCDQAFYDTTGLGFWSDRQMPLHTTPFQMAVTFAKNDAPKSARIDGLNGRAPTESESWVSPGGNSYFFFSGTVSSDAPVHVAAGSTIDVWFPFVLDPSFHYSITIAYTKEPVGPLDGTLHDSVVHFVLPAFTLTPGAHLIGEIEGNSWAQP